MESTVTTVAEEKTERIPILDLYASPSKVTEQLKRAGQLVLTNNDGPVAVMLDVDDSNLKDTLLEVRRLRAQRIIKAMQEAAVRNGLSNMTLEEINAEISAARAEKRARENNR